MQNYYKYFLLFIFIFLVGCEPAHTIFGVRESVWYCLCSSERAAAIETYNREQAAKARANPPYCRLKQHLYNMPRCNYNPYFGN